MRVRVLLVEDSPVDAIMVERVLAKGGYELAVERVETADALEAALTREPWDLVLADYSMPGWTGLDALAVVQELTPDVPFILVSGTIGEELAVQAMQSGVSDYLLKDRLTRLPAAVRRALEAAELRREHGRSRVALAFLAQASVQLSQSLDARAVAETLLALAVPLLADGAAVDLVDEAGALRRVAASDAPVTDAEVDQALARAAIHDLAPVLRQDGGDGQGSCVALPLVVRGTAVGCLTLELDPHGRSFQMIDGGVGVELAARAAIALQNARLYAQAQAAIATRDEFLQLAAHELRTPLTPLATQVQSLLRSSRATGGTAPVARFDAEIEATGRHVQRLAKLVDRLLDVSELGLGAPTLVYEPCDLAALVNEITDGFASQAHDAGSTLTVAVPETLPGSWDRARLGQVVSSLVSNALKFGAGKPVDVTLVRHGDVARLAVRDQGVGIAAVDRTRIFERFERAVSFRRYGGFGLGLWLGREIVRAHGGTIAVVSAPGEGATFTVELPLTAPAGLGDRAPLAHPQN